MAKIRTDVLDVGVLRFLDGTELDRKVGLAMQLVSAEEDGSCHVALLSVGEVLAPDDGTIALALHATSSTTANLRGQGRALLCLVLDGACIDVELAVRSSDQVEIQGKEHALFLTDVTRVWRDEVGYARISSGITYELLREAEVVGRWQETVETMRALQPG
jgi:hypothetical protein